MDEKLVQRYVDMLSGKVNELVQENILLKAKFSLATEEIQKLKQLQNTTEIQNSGWSQQSQDQEVENDNSNKAKKK